MPKLSPALRDFQRGFIKHAITIHHGSITDARKMLGMSKRQIEYWTRTLDLVDYASTLRTDANRALYYRCAQRSIIGITLLYSITLH